MRYRRRMADAEVDRLNAEYDRFEDQFHEFERKSASALGNVLSSVGKLCRALGIQPDDLANLLEDDPGDNFDEILFESEPRQAIKWAVNLKSYLEDFRDLQAQMIAADERRLAADDALYAYKEELKRFKQLPEATDYERLVEE